MLIAENEVYRREARGSRLTRFACRAGGGLLVALIAAVAASVLVPPLAGYDRYAVEDGSMAPAIPRGSIVVAQPVPVSKLKKNDVITYTRPGAPGPVTQRIVSSDRDRLGRRVFWTKGDAEARPEPTPVHITAAEQPRVAMHAPYAGFVLIALEDPSLLPLLLGALMLGIGAASLAALGSQSRRPLSVARRSA